jgi:hypothetical protein
MKHIKIYEEYSDDELKDLLGDLESVGHKHRILKGEDYGFNEDMKGENTGANTLYLSKFGKEVLEKNLKKDFDGKGYMTTYGFKLEDIFPYFRGIPGTKTSSSRYHSNISAHIYAIDNHWKYKNVVDSAKKDFPPYFVWVSSGPKNFPASYWGQAHKQMGKDRVKKIYNGVLQYLEKIQGKV